MRHPVSVCVPVNYKVTLSVRAESTGILKYQWFTDDEKRVCEVSDTQCGMRTVSLCLSLLLPYMFVLLCCCGLLI